MKKIVVLTILAIALSLWTAQVQAITVNTYEFAPTPANLDNLDHHYYYSWGIEWDIPSTEVIESAFLQIHQINNWYEPWETTDVLHLWLLDQLPALNWQYVNWPGISGGWDNQNYSDAFGGSDGTFLTDFTDDNAFYNKNKGWINPTETLTIPVPVDALTSYVNNDSLFGIGFDPDCHYVNSGIKLIVNTRVGASSMMPEPATMLGSVLGLGALGGYIRRRKRMAKK